MTVIPMGQGYCLDKMVRYSLLHSRCGWGVEVACGGERSTLPALSPDERSVRALLERMMRGQVTPVTAADVAEDWLNG